MKKYWVATLLGLLLFLIDRTIKYLISQAPSAGFFITKQLGLNYYLNPGLAFGLPLPNVMNIVLTSAVLLLLIVWLKRKLLFQLWPLILIYIGAISNLIDRIRFGGVIDYLIIPIWPVFNLADCYIVLGIILLALDLKNQSRSQSLVSGNDKNNLISSS